MYIVSFLQSTILHFIVLTFDRYSRDEIIGEVFFPLNSIDIINQEDTMYQKDIQPRNLKVPFIWPFKLWNSYFSIKNTAPAEISICFFHFQVKNQGRGEILVSLCWQPAANRLTIVILKARNLPKMDVTGLAGK